LTTEQIIYKEPGQHIQKPGQLAKLLTFISSNVFSDDSTIVNALAIKENTVKLV